MKILCFFKIFVTVYPFTQHYIPEHFNLQQHCCVNLKFFVALYCLSVLGHKFDNMVINQGLDVVSPQEVQMVELSQWHPEATNRILKVFVQQHKILQIDTTSSVTCTYS